MQANRIQYKQDCHTQTKNVFVLNCGLKNFTVVSSFIIKREDDIYVFSVRRKVTTAVLCTLQPAQRVCVEDKGSRGAGWGDGIKERGVFLCDHDYGIATQRTCVPPGM